MNAAKDVIRSHLNLTQPGPGFMHFPSARSIDYFEQLIAEQLVTRRVGDQNVRVWQLPAGKRSEALDCRALAYAGLHGLKRSRIGVMAEAQ